jgi:glycosyltransferase involved in cell wall biosynthesis
VASFAAGDGRYSRRVPSLVAVVPVYNQSAELAETLAMLDRGISATGFEAEILVIDDGSTDGSGDVARAYDGTTPVRVIEQENAGRFAARRRGIDTSRAEYCLLIDSRVSICDGALAFVESQLPERAVWNAHVDIDVEGSPFGVFWDVITQRAFWEYFRQPRDTSFGTEEFDRFPKGTTCFFAPRALLAEAFDSFRTSYADLRNANDDTPVIRWLAERCRINISPRFACRYQSRRRLGPFLSHAHHRGVVFVDGHARRGSRFAPAIVAFYPLSVGWVVASAWRWPIVAAPVVLASAAGAALALSERRGRDAATMAWVTPLWASAYSTGMWRGLALAARARLAGGRA